MSMYVPFNCTNCGEHTPISQEWGWLCANCGYGYYEDKEMQVEVVERKDSPGIWSVEAIDYENDGVIYLTLFSGPDSEARAREYKEMKYV